MALVDGGGGNDFILVAGTKYTIEVQSPIDIPGFFADLARAFFEAFGATVHNSRVGGKSLFVTFSV